MTDAEQILLDEIRLLRVDVKAIEKDLSKVKEKMTVRMALLGASGGGVASAIAQFIPFLHK